MLAFILLHLVHMTINMAAYCCYMFTYQFPNVSSNVIQNTVSSNSFSAKIYELFSYHYLNTMIT